MPFTLISHPVIQHELTLLRDRATPPPTFRAILRRMSRILAIEVSRFLPVEPMLVDTPLEQCPGSRLAESIVLVPILRAGLGMVDGFLDILPQANVGHIGMKRNEETLQPVSYYANIPAAGVNAHVLVLDPMLATGGSALAAIQYLKERCEGRITFVSIVAAPPGADLLTSTFPELDVVTCSLDRVLNERGYILPGLGDAGDRLYGTL